MMRAAKELGRVDRKAPDKCQTFTFNISATLQGCAFLLYEYELLSQISPTRKDTVFYFELFIILSIGVKSENFLYSS